jgi:hypothetical protein
LNRYIGNTGRFFRVGETPPSVPASLPRAGEAPARAYLPGFPAPPWLPAGLESGDLALLLLFFFLYVESGDEEFLIMLAVLAAGVFA